MLTGISGSNTVLSASQRSAVLTGPFAPSASVDVASLETSSPSASALAPLTRNIPLWVMTVKLPPSRWVMVTVSPSGKVIGVPCGMSVTSTSRVSVT